MAFLFVKTFGDEESMLQELHALDGWMDFINDVNADARYRSPMLQCERQLRENLLDAPENPAMRVFGVLDGSQPAGLFSFLVLPEERYIEMLAGLSRREDAYAQMLVHLKAAYPGYRADFVCNPENELLLACLRGAGAAFDPEQQKLVLKSPAPYSGTCCAMHYMPEYEAQYRAMHASDCYWTAERVLDAPETFRVILALDGERLAGYLDVTRSAAVNEIYDLYVAEPYRRRGFARAMLAEAIAQNVASDLMVLTEAADRTATALYQSMGFVPAAGENSVLASMTLT